MTERTTLTSEDINFAGRGYPVDREKDSSLPYGINSNRVGYTEIDLSVARTESEIHISGNVFAVYNSSSPMAYAEVRLDEYGSNGLFVRDGFILQGVPFRKIWVSNKAQPNQKLRILHAIDPQVRFNFVAPPPITSLMAHLSGFGYRSEPRSTAVTAKIGSLVFYNPPSSEKVAVIHSLHVNTDFYMSRTSTPTTFDSASAEDIYSTFMYGSGITANALGTSAMEIYVGYDAPLLELETYDIGGNVGANIFDQNIAFTLGPGDNLCVKNTTANQLIRGYFKHFEVPLELYQ